jgi:hypothetical protein
MPGTRPGMTGGEAVQPPERSNGASVDCHGSATLLARLVGDSVTGELSSGGQREVVYYSTISSL